MESVIIKNKLNGAFYSGVVKRICFRFDEEKVHNFFVKTGKIVEGNIFSRKITKMIFNYQNSCLEQKIFGIKFRNPLGLSAGFDKNAELISAMEDVGFGFCEVGSVTAKPCKGNSGRRILRIPEKKSIWVNLGLNNNGADEISSRLKGRKFGIPIGVNIAKTNCKETLEPEKGISDYVYSLKRFSERKVGNYFTINISCPNSYGGQPFSEPELYDSLLREIKKLKISRPILVKLSPDLEKNQLDKILNISEKHKIDGFVCSNLTKKNNSFKKGGMSGKEVSSKSNNLLSQVYKKTRRWKNAPVLIGVGGIFSAEDAYNKIKLGASLVQLITGMIYQGPGVISEINYGLTKLLKKDGFANISEAVGSGYKKARRKNGKYR